MDVHAIRELVLNDRFHLTQHAQDELANENLRLDDVATALLSGEIINEDVDPDRGAEWLVEGMNWMKETIRAKVALDDEGDLIVITLYSRRQQRRTR